jgi:hypothetical protein
MCCGIRIPLGKMSFVSAAQKVAISRDFIRDFIRDFPDN